MIIILSGLTAGAVHVLSGPDHLAAVAPLSMTRQGGKSWLIGVRWGVGHASGVILVAIIAYLVRELFLVDSIAWLSGWAEKLVGLALVGIGIWGVRKAMSNRVHTHEHTHEGRPHLHVHVHGKANAHPVSQPNSHFHTHTAFAIGTLHGLAGSSHFLGVLPALAMPTRTLTALYLLAYGLGTVVTMAGFSSLMDFVAAKSSLRGDRIYKAVTAGVSVIAIGIGCFWFLRN